jgi:hypothetical protein
MIVRSKPIRRGPGAPSEEGREVGGLIEAGGSSTDHARGVAMLARSTGFYDDLTARIVDGDVE